MVSEVGLPRFSEGFRERVVLDLETGDSGVLVRSDGHERGLPQEEGDNSATPLPLYHDDLYHIFTHRLQQHLRK